MPIHVDHHEMLYRSILAVIEQVDDVILIRRLGELDRARCLCESTV